MLLELILDPSNWQIFQRKTHLRNTIKLQGTCNFLVNMACLVEEKMWGTRRINFIESFCCPKSHLNDTNTMNTIVVHMFLFG